ncbi:MAG: molybdenum cofactor guanylyltransferase MobA [Sulfurovaceae bacterium]|nr:molybdenum cofactor guanylyltransferase MobA [Sulfurovaceae bacterium]
MQEKIAVIIAGGRSSRMKRDKALLPFAQFGSLAEYQQTRLSIFFDRVYISAKSNKFSFNVALIEDRYEVSSPLVAIVSIFETLEVSEVFILSVDTPFVSVEIIETLYKESSVSNSDVILAKSINGIEPLCAIYRKSVLPLAKEFLDKDIHRLRSFLDSVEYSIVEFEDERAFSNLNHPKEYEKALLIGDL